MKKIAILISALIPLLCSCTVDTYDTPSETLTGNWSVRTVLR